MARGGLWQRYTALVEARPVLVKSLTAASLAVVGDVGAQAIEWRAWQPPTGPGARQAPPAFRFDVRRTAGIALFRGVLFAPVAHRYFAWLDRRFGSAADWRTIGKKMLVDQLVATHVNHVVFFTSQSLFEGRWRLADIGAKLADKYPSFLQANYAFWPWVHLLTFTVVPLTHRVGWVNLCAIFWNGYIGSLNARPAGGAGGVGAAPPQPKQDQ